MKEQIIFWGAGIQGKRALDKFESEYGRTEELLGFSDNRKCGTYLDYPIWKLEEIRKETTSIVITIEQSWAAADVFHFLKENNFKSIYWYTGFSFSKGESFLEQECISCEKWREPILPQVEMHVIDYCNLNCKGCAHFSPIFEKKMPNTLKRLEDIRLLKDKFGHILKLFLLGGEPLLNPELERYVVECRQYLPDTLIEIVTNGLLIPKLNPKVLEVIRDNKIVISISEYEPTYKRIEAIEEILKRYQICYIIRPFDQKQKFNKPLSISCDGSYLHKCISDGCINVYDGMIARCPTLMYINEFNQFFHTDFPSEGIYKIQDLSANEILDFMKKEVSLCKFCVENEIEWECCGNSPCLEDFCVKC